MNFKNAVCDYLRHNGFKGIIWSVTTTPAQYHAQIKSKNWRLVRYGRATRNKGCMYKDMLDRMIKNSSRMRITYSFVYVGNEGVERLTQSQSREREENKSAVNCTEKENKANRTKIKQK